MLEGRGTRGRLKGGEEREGNDTRRRSRSFRSERTKRREVLFGGDVGLSPGDDVSGLEIFIERVRKKNPPHQLETCAVKKRGSRAFEREHL